MSSGQLRVDYDALADMAGVLDGLKDEFNGVEDNVGSYSGDSGHGGVTDALGKFASNWSDAREEITEGMEGVVSFADGAAGAYREADDEIGNEFTK